MFTTADISLALRREGLINNKGVIKEIIIDSRAVSIPDKSLFVAIYGKNFDGHDFVENLYHRGVRNFIVTERRDEFEDLSDANFWYVDNSIDAIQQIAIYYRKSLGAEFVAVTGSNGKTIVKEWIAQMIETDYKFYRSPRSYNSQLGVPLSVLGVSPDDEIAVIEAGISKPGEMAKLERIIRPNVGIFTCLGDAHSENFESFEEKLEEKIKLFEWCETVICKDGDTCELIRARINSGVRLFVWGKSDNVDLRVISDVTWNNARNIEMEYENEVFCVSIPFEDEASYENVMNVIAYLLYKNVEISGIVERAKELQAVAMRLEIREGVNNCVLINDYYNSDFSSFGLALDVLKKQNFPNEKLVVLSDFVEIGSNMDTVYKRVADMLSEAGISIFIGIGENISKCRKYFHKLNSRFYETTEDFLKQENREFFNSQLILLKGARKYRFEYISGFLQKKSHTTILEVDLDAMSRNLEYFRSKLAAKTKIAVMVKAFSYGAGSIEVAKCLQSKNVDYLMVAFADEGVELRSAGLTVNIGVMNPEVEAFDNMIEFNLQPEIYSMELLEEFNRHLVKHGIYNYPVHLKLNTGMNRSGLDEGDIPGLIDFINGHGRVCLASVFSHLAVSDDETQDDFTLFQIEKFEKMTKQIQKSVDYKVIRHILNSAGIERFPEYSFDMVRLGIGLHGISAVGACIEPVSAFKTHIVSIRNIKAGETVGYGRKATLTRDSKVAVIPVGYADGLDRHLSCGVGELFLRAKRVPILGNICMDACMLDVTDTDAQVGDEVEIFGKNISVNELAEKLGTISYEVLTSVSSRVKRVYYKD